MVGKGASYACGPSAADYEVCSRSEFVQVRTCAHALVVLT